MYQEILYRVWTSMPGVDIQVLVDRDYIRVLGETRAVREAAWDHLFWKHPVTGSLLRRWGKMYAAGAGVSVEQAHTVLRHHITEAIKFEKITIERTA